MRLDVSSAAPSLVFQLPGGRVERVPYDHVEVFVGRVVLRVTRHGDLARWRRDVDTDREKAALGPVPVRHVHHDVAPDDAIVKPLEP